MPAFPTQKRMKFVQSRRQDANIVVSRNDLAEFPEYAVCVSAPPLIRASGHRLDVSCA